MILRACSGLLTLVSISLSLFSTGAFAQENNQQQPSAAFLEFLADISEVDGEITDPLDMLELEDSELLNTSADKKSENETDINLSADEIRKAKVKVKILPQKNSQSESQMLSHKDKVVNAVNANKPVEQDQSLIQERNL